MWSIVKGTDRRNADYCEAASSAASRALLTGTPGPSPWDPDLADALTAVGLRVEEESVLGDLLSDLAPPGA